MVKKGMVWGLIVLLVLVSVPTTLAQDMTGAALPSGNVAAGGAQLYAEPVEGAKQLATLAGGAEVIVLRRSGNWAQVFVHNGQKVGWMMGGAVQTAYGTMFYPGIVISQSVSLREEPKTNAKLVSSIPNGAMINILQEQSGWYYASYWDGKTNVPKQGWVRTDFIVRNPTFLTTTQSTYVYATPSRSAKKVGQLIAGTQLVVIGEYGDFWVVNLRSASGFIYKGDVQGDVGNSNG